MLYQVVSDFTLQVIPSGDMQKHLFQEAHEGRFGVHLSDSKEHS